MNLNRSGCIRWVVRLFGLLGAIYLFRYELILLWNLLTGKPGTVQPDQLVPVLSFIGAAVLAMLVLSAILILMIGMSILPVTHNGQETERINHFLHFLGTGRAPLYRVREGIIDKKMAVLPGGGQSSGDVLSGKSRSGPGTAYLVDLNSAILLEKGRYRGWQRSGPEVARSHRVGHAGLVFPSSRERLSGVVSLRKQFGRVPDVLCSTSDSIELKTSVSAIFSISHAPEVIRVAYCGPYEWESIRVLKINPRNWTIQAVYDDLDDPDKQEIHAFAGEFIGVWNPLEPLAVPPSNPDRPPYPLDHDRIHQAVHARAIDPKTGSEDRWTDLPARVAAEVFRSMLTRVTYDSLYNYDPDLTSTLHTVFKPQFSRRVQNLGVLSYQLIHPKQEDRCPAVGDRVHDRFFYISPVRPLTNPKMVRDAGIKIIAAGFSDLQPIDPKVKEQRANYWRTIWQYRGESLKAELLRDAEKILQTSRIEKQTGIIENLVETLQDTTYSEEALALCIFEALEDLTAQPATRQMMPDETLRLIQNLRPWLMPTDDSAPRALP